MDESGLWIKYAPCQHELILDRKPLYDDPIDEVLSGVECYFCGLTISASGGPYYRCAKSCQSSYSHKSCSEDPEDEIQHPFHPQHSLFLRQTGRNHEFGCFACATSWGHRSYVCFDCPFDLDMACANLQVHGMVQLPSHDHPLFLCDYNKYDSFHYFCRCCGQIRHEGPVYACLECNALLHKSCAESALIIIHPLHPLHFLILHSGLIGEDDESGLFFCSLCDLEGHGLRYTCVAGRCSYEIHLGCASLVPVAIRDNTQVFEEGRFQTIRLPTHSCPLILLQKNKHHFLQFMCYGCRETMAPTETTIYYCSEHKIFLHKSCAELPQEIKTPLDPFDHLLTLAFEPEGDEMYNIVGFTACAACDDILGKLIYRCSLCKLHIDPKCALLLPTAVMSANHQHPLVLFDQPIRKPFNCCICDYPCNSPFFRCVLCYRSFHVYCLPKLPTKVKSVHHRHPLTLTYHPIKDEAEEDDDSEFYCDNCEERRNLREPSYYCEACHFVAHVHCMITQVMLLLEEEWSVASKCEDIKYEIPVNQWLINDRQLSAVDKELVRLRDEKEGLQKKLIEVERRIEELEAEKENQCKLEDRKLDASMELNEGHADETISEVFRVLEKEQNGKLAHAKRIESSEEIASSSKTETLGSPTRADIAGKGLLHFEKRNDEDWSH